MRNKENGYEPKCKVCNHAKKEEIERLHDLGNSNRDIIRKLNITKEDFTEQALGRHLNNHYPISKKHNEKEVMEYVEYNNGLKKILLNNSDNQTFLNEKGYCYDCNKLCHLIPAKQSLMQREVLKSLDSKLDVLVDIDSYNQNEYSLDLLKSKCYCYDCYLWHKNNNYDVILETIINKLFNLNITFEKINNAIYENEFYKSKQLLEYLEELK